MSVKHQRQRAAAFKRRLTRPHRHRCGPLPYLVGLVVSALVVSGQLEAASATPPINDQFEDRLQLQLGSADTRANDEAGVEIDERLTPNDPDGNGCTAAGSAAPSGVQMDQTLWWEFVGNGGPVTVSSLGSDFDTVLAVYEAVGMSLISCNDDLQAYDPTQPDLEFRLASEVPIDTVAGDRYIVQVGGCRPASACGASTSGTVTLRASPPPANDDRALAKTISAAGSVASSNTGATLESGEPSSCYRFDDRTSPYAKTVWFRYTAPAPGTAVFSASGFDTVLAVYRGNDSTAIGCNDDAVSGEYGPSRLPMSQPPGPPVFVVPGDYLIQVGGYHDPGFSEVAARNGPFSVQVEFFEDLDRDDDGVDRIRDCDDSNPTVRPGARDVPENGIDEDCSGSDAGFPRLGVTFSAVWEVHAGETHVFAVVGRKVPGGTTIKLRCRPDPLCPFSARRLLIRHSRTRASLLEGLPRSAGDPLIFRAGARLDIRAAKREFTGVGRTYRMRRGHDPVWGDYCFGPGGRRRLC